MVEIKKYSAINMTSVVMLLLSACNMGVHATTVFYKYGHTTFEDFAEVHCDLVDGDISAIIYDGKRVELKNGGKNLERIKASFPFFYNDDDPRRPGHKTVMFTTKPSPSSVFLSVGEDAEGHLSFSTWPVNLGGGKFLYPVQIEFRHHLITFPVKKEDLEKMLGKPDSIEEKHSYAA